MNDRTALLRRVFALCSYAALTSLFTACNLSMLEPAKTTGSAPIVSISLSAPKTDGSRAIVQGAGFLYLRTIGGPTGDKGPFYGPYAVMTGQPLSITDVPAGKFQKCAIIFSAKKLESERRFAMLGGDYTFTEVMSGPDSLFNSLLAATGKPSEDQGLRDFENWFGGQASFGVTENVVLKAGSTTKLSLTLAQIVGSEETIDTFENPEYVFASQSADRRFYRLTNIRALSSATTGSFSCTLTAPATGGGTIGAVAFYAADGSPVPAEKTGDSLANGITWSLGAAAIKPLIASTGIADVYLYAETTGAVMARFANTIAPNLRIAIDGEPTAAWQGKRVLYGIYGESAVTAQRAGKSLLKAPTVALGVVSLDAKTGDGYAQIRSDAIVPGSTYFISAQIDVGGHYASISDFKGVDVATIVPYKNDLVMIGETALTDTGVYGLKTIAPGTAAALAVSDFEFSDTMVYFASEGGGGNGLSPDKPTTFANALTYAADNAPAQIYLTGDITYAIPKTISTWMTIQSYGSAIRTLSTGSTSLMQSLFTVGNTGHLEFNSITIDCSKLTYAMDSLIKTNAASGSNVGYLAFGSDATLIGSPAVSIANGGGVYIGAGSAFEMWGSSIINCKATSGGGGVYIYAEGVNPTNQVRIGPGVLFKGNSAMMGGAIYIQTATYAQILSTTFTENVATTTGYAVIHNRGTTAFKDLTFIGNFADYEHLEESGGTWNPM